MELAFSWHAPLRIKELNSVQLNLRPWLALMKALPTHFFFRTPLWIDSDKSVLRVLERALCRSECRIRGVTRSKIIDGIVQLTELEFDGFF